MRGRGRGFGEKGRWGAVGPAKAQEGAPGAAGPAGVGPRRGREEKKRREKEREKERKDLLLIFEIRSFYMNAFALSNNQRMHSSAWCIKQHKVFRVFHCTGIPNRIPLKLWKRSRFSEGKKKKKR
jgi:hypothetical protein